MKFRIEIERDEDGAFIPSCPTLPGCWSQGTSRDEAVRNIGEATKAYLVSLDTSGDPIPPAISEEVIEVAVKGKKAGRWAICP